MLKVPDLQPGVEQLMLASVDHVIMKVLPDWSPELLPLGLCKTIMEV